MLVLAGIVASCASDPNIESAKLNLRNNDFQGVITSAEAALAENPENADAFYYIGVAHLQIADEKAVTERRDNLASARENMLRADELYRQQEISSNESETAIQLLINRWADEYSLAVGGVDFEADNSPEVLQKSIDHLYNAYTVMPDSIMTLDALSEIYFMKDDVDNAVKYMEMAIDKASEPELTRYQRLTFFYQIADNVEGSLSILERAAVIFPDETFFVQEQANIYFRTGQNEKAMAVLEDLIAQDPENAQYRLVFGSQIYQEYLNLTSDIAALYDELFDKNQRFREMVRSGQSNQNRIREVEREIDGIQNRITSLDNTRFEIAERAEEQLMIAFEMEPDNPNTTYTLGAINENRGLALIDQVNNIYDDSLDLSAMEQQANSYFMAALPFYEKTAELEPEDPDNWLKLFQLYLRLGMDEEAQAAAERAGI